MLQLLVTADGTNNYPALVEPERRWNGWLVPCFTLETVRRISADLTRFIDEYGWHNAEDIRVLTSPGAPEPSEDDDHDVPIVVVHISWGYGDPAEARIVEQTDDGY